MFPTDWHTAYNWGGAIPGDNDDARIWDTAHGTLVTLSANVGSAAHENTGIDGLSVCGPDSRWIPVDIGCTYLISGHRTRRLVTPSWITVERNRRAIQVTERLTPITLDDRGWDNWTDRRQPTAQRRHRPYRPERSRDGQQRHHSLSQVSFAGGAWFGSDAILDPPGTEGAHVEMTATFA